MRFDLGERLFRTALYAFPPEFRRRFAGEMLDFFRSRRGRARRRGASVSFAIRTAADLARSIGREWRRRSALLHPHHRKAPAMTRFRSDITGAARFLRRTPGLSLAIILLMGSGIAAATAVFSVVNHVLLTPPPFADPSRLVMLWEARPERGPGRYNVSGHEYPVWAARTATLEGSTAFTFTGGSASLTGAGDPVALTGVRVTASFFSVLGSRPVLGRGFTAEEDAPGHGRAVVISHRLWRERLRQDEAAVGSKLVLDGVPHEVVGVMPPAFAFPAPPPGATLDIWRPIAEPFHLYRGRHYMNAVGRLRAGKTHQDAEADLNVAADALAADMPELNRGHRVRVTPLVEELVGERGATLMLLQGAVIGLLLIGCANVAGLLMASGLRRRRELAVRLALGAGRLRIARQLIIETVMLCTAGCAAGIAGAWLLTRAAPALVPVSVMAVDGISLNPTVIAFAIALSALTGLLVGIAPVFQMSGLRLTDALGTRGATMDRLGPRRLLVAAQIALTLVLAAGAAVSIRTLASLHAVDTGFEGDRIVASSVALPGARYRMPSAQRAFFGELKMKLRDQPGVESVALANATPLDGGVTGIAVSVEGRPPARPGEELSVRYRVVSSDYFATLGIRLLRGRSFTESDARRAVPLIKWYPQQPAPDGFDLPQAAPAAVINESMARALWPGDDALGRRFRAVLSPPITVIGIVADTRDESVEAAPRPGFYLHDLQEPLGAMALLVRTDRDAAAAASMIRSAVWSIDPQLPVGRVAPMADFVSANIGLPRFTSTLLGAFAALALSLMAAGVYALIAFGTRMRAKEIGVRRALGATDSGIVAMIVRQGMGLAVVGCVAGGLAVGALRPLARLLPFDAGAVDAWVIAGAMAAVVGVVGLAAWLPARQASKIDPLMVLRQD